jgi:hypothetical protein
VTGSSVPRSRRPDPAARTTSPSRTSTLSMSRLRRSPRGTLVLHEPDSECPIWISDARRRCRVRIRPERRDVRLMQGDGR